VFSIPLNGKAPLHKYPFKYPYLWRRISIPHFLVQSSSTIRHPTTSFQPLPLIFDLQSKFVSTPHTAVLSQCHAIISFVTLFDKRIFYTSYTSWGRRHDLSICMFHSYRPSTINYDTHRSLDRPFLQRMFIDGGRGIHESRHI
jgi:hypothetical protein